MIRYLRSLWCDWFHSMWLQYWGPGDLRFYCAKCDRFEGDR